MPYGASHYLHVYVTYSTDTPRERLAVLVMPGSNVWHTLPRRRRLNGHTCCGGRAVTLQYVPV